MAEDETTRPPSSRRRPRPAAQPWEHEGALKYEYLSLYGLHEDFAEELDRLYRAHCIDHVELVLPAFTLWDLDEHRWRESRHEDWANKYISAIEALAVRFGLDRLEPGGGGRFDPSGGEQLIHAWCRERADYARWGHELTARQFAIGVTAGGGRPDAKDRLYVELDDAWDPREERAAHARKRLMRAIGNRIDSEMERIARRAEAMGYEFHDTRPKEPEHLRWLFERVALKRTYGEIARKYLDSWALADTVSNAIKPYADRLRVDLSLPARP
jgi:hypothetical protein